MGTLAPNGAWGATAVGFREHSVVPSAWRHAHSFTVLAGAPAAAEDECYAGSVQEQIRGLQDDSAELDEPDTATATEQSSLGGAEAEPRANWTQVSAKRAADEDSVYQDQRRLQTVH